MKQHRIGKLIYYGMPWFTLARRLFGTRWLIIPKQWNGYRYVLGKHFRGIDEDGQKFVYCPVSLLVSWSPGDYDHEWCHACELFFSQKVRSLL